MLHIVIFLAIRTKLVTDVYICEQRAQKRYCHVEWQNQSDHLLTTSSYMKITNKLHYAVEVL